MVNEKDVLYRGEVLTLTEYFGRPCLFIQKPSQIGLPKMQFVGGYPNEYCIYLSDLTDEEKHSVTDLKGRQIDLDEFFTEKY